MNRVAAELLRCLNQLKMSQRKSPPTGDLHANEAELLLFLKHSEKPKQTISELSRAFGVTNSSITQQVNRLETLGCVHKETDENDCRRIFVGLTLKGAGIVMKIDRNCQNRAEQLVQFLGESDANELVRLLARVAEYYKAEQNAN